MSRNLVIVESPAKAKTIKKYLGKDFEVMASYGHVRDLVPKEGAVDPTRQFAMRWELIDKNRKHVDAIARAVKKADALYLSTDPDREGEAISWHLYELLKDKGALDGKAVHRSVFYEITEERRAGGRSTSRARSPRNWSRPTLRDERSTILLASTSRRCCGRRRGCRAHPPDACRVRRCG